MTERRQRRVAEEIQRRASVFIRDELKDPRIGFVTVTGADINSDLTQAVIYVSVLGEEKEQQETMAALRGAKGLVKRDIGDWLSIRTVPEISFKYDESIERGTRVLKLLESVQAETKE
jgi:ribosome-binding factor A